MDMQEAGPAPPGMNRTLRENIATLASRRDEEARAASLADRISDHVTVFAGSMRFVVMHLLIFGGWIAANTGILPGVPRFDPSLVVLAMAASVEAIFLSTFVLISQNRMAAASERRADLDLHISLLAEHELTRLADLVARIATRLDVTVDDPEFTEITRNVEPAQVLDEIERIDESPAA